MNRNKEFEVMFNSINDKINKIKTDVLNPTAKQEVRTNLDVILNDVNLFLALYSDADFKGQRLVYNNGGDSPNLFLYLDSASPFAFYENLTTHETFYLSNATTLDGSNNPKWQKLAYDDEVVKKAEDQTITSKKTFIPVQDFLNGINVNGSKITSVGDGVNDEDAVNVKQLNEKFSQLEFIKIVETLPEVGVENIIYIVPSQEPSETNKYDEFIWVESIQKFEPFGSGVTLDINLDDYYKKKLNINIEDNLLDIKGGKSEFRLGTSTVFASIKRTGTELMGIPLKFSDNNNPIYVNINNQRIEIRDIGVGSTNIDAGLISLSKGNKLKTIINERGVVIESKNDGEELIIDENTISKSGTPGLIKNFTIENEFNVFKTTIQNGMLLDYDFGGTKARTEYAMGIDIRHRLLDADNSIYERNISLNKDGLSYARLRPDGILTQETKVDSASFTSKHTATGKDSRLDPIRLKMNDATNSNSIEISADKIEYRGEGKGQLINFDVGSGGEGSGGNEINIYTVRFSGDGIHASCNVFGRIPMEEDGDGKINFINFLRNNGYENHDIIVNAQIEKGGKMFVATKCTLNDGGMVAIDGLFTFEYIDNNMPEMIGMFTITQFSFRKV